MAYHEHLPKTEPLEQYEVRMDLYEMFHYLNHTVLFGVSSLSLGLQSQLTVMASKGGYASSAERKMDRVLAACAVGGTELEIVS